MRHETQLGLLDRLLDHVDRKTTQLAATDSSVPVAWYTSPERLSGETQLFRRHPIVVAHVSELPAPFDFVTHDATGVPLLVVRDREGELHAFLNVCRHRGAKLITEARGTRKGFVCRYHAWAYDLAGKLIHVPQQEAFPSLNPQQAGLVALPLKVVAGFIWVTPTEATKLEPDLGPYAEDLDGFGLTTHHLHRKVVERRACNWKLVIDAFLEGYHVKSLHRDTLARFFTDTSVADTFGPHVRSAGARRNLAEAREVPRERWDVRTYATVFYFLFPNTVLVFHPDWVSQITMFPDGTDHSWYQHAMLIPALPKTDAERAHLDKTFDLIEGNVFQKEDLSIAESIQRTLGSGANQQFRIGRLEDSIRHFHQALDRAITDG